MRFKIKNGRKGNESMIARKIGYIYIKKDKDEINLVRPLERGGYPRFHLYLKIDQRTHELIFNLHLDQKRPIYKGASAHSADYEGEPVEEEAARIKEILQKDC